MLLIKQITSKETYIVRHPILRDGKPIETCCFDGDDFSTTKHFGIFDNDKIIGVVSAYEKSCLEFNEKWQYQLRGMAILKEYQNNGFGELLLSHVEGVIKKMGANLIWFNARESAVGFYEKKNYQKIGTRFDIPDVGFHFIMYKKMV